MNFDETIADLKDGRLDFDCTSMSLVQCKEDGISFEGKGYIRQSEEGVLTFKIYASHVVNMDQYRCIQTFFETRSGELYSADDFYELIAVARNGTRWTAEHILPDCDWSTDGNAIVKGTVASLVTRLTTDQSIGYVRIHFFDDLEVPLTLMSKTESDGLERYQCDKAKFSAIGCEFEIRKRSGELVIEAGSDKQFPEFLYLRIQEALHYLVAKPVTWRAQIERQGTQASLKIASAMPKSANTKLNPPIRPRSVAFREDGWRLFALYLDYVVRSTSGPYWGHCTYHLHNACEASANSIDAWAVGVSVAVEGIASLIQTSLDATRSEKLTAFQQSLRTFVADHEEFSEFAPRMNGLIGMLGTERVQDKLVRLATSGHVNPTYIKSWSKLRNRHVHPKLADLTKMAIGDMQELLDLIRQVEVLMWQLTFYIVGYAGKFSDGATYDSPSREYPLSVSGEAPNE
jgi:hypothetical protein